MRGILLSLIAALATGFVMSASAQDGEAGNSVCQPGGGDGGSLEECSDTGELQLSGTVTTLCAIEVVPTEEATNLDIVGGETGTKVATVTETANNNAGYRVFVASENGGTLDHQTDADEQVPYQLSYNGGSLFSPTSTAVEVKDSGELAGFTQTDSDIEITFAGASDARAGVYSDVVTISIEAI